MINFKFLLAVSSVLAVSTVEARLRASEFGPRIQSIAPRLHSICKFRTGVLDYSINSVINGVFIDDPLIKSYAACLFRESNLMSARGEFNYELGAYLLPADIKDEAISNAKYCDTEIRGSAKVEDRLYELLKCFYSLDPDIFIFF
ncbi:uncharacterized protein LOC108905092 [Anoplophora glabripennis]|uniref:uncharacterized protein LOC108905092 n=1 Tax=Anoplophora glabripennis TaxID=217634 RepID=UPI000874396B|nr:uncharacterized protein LOC108905092 [Anoplophora glabripennis]